MRGQDGRNERQMAKDVKEDKSERSKKGTEERERWGQMPAVSECFYCSHVLTPASEPRVTLSKLSPEGDGHTEHAQYSWRR
ncbi:hypothetical protein SRHO_G00128850 [Serrasalmus rhombeus]